MSFQCPSCTNKKSLKIIESIELPPDSRSDEISLQVVRCITCNYLGLAVYEESSRGALGSESVDHYGYLADQKISKTVQSMIMRCPKPRNAKCECATHQELNNRDKSSRWLRPGLEPGQQTYPMKKWALSFKGQTQTVFLIIPVLILEGTLCYKNHRS